MRISQKIELAIAEISQKENKKYWLPKICKKYGLNPKYIKKIMNIRK